MNKHALLTGFLGVVIGALATYALTASAPGEHRLEPMGMGQQQDAMHMSMDDMAGMLNGKNGDAFDQAFLEGMIPHHQGAIDMANAALQQAGHEEIKAMARDIIAAQQREIDMMRGWQQAWGFSH